MAEDRFPTTRAQKVAATTAVMRRVPEGDDRDWVLRALFATCRVRPPRGTVGKKVPHSRVYAYPCPVGPVGEAYRARVRAWGREQGHKPCRGPLEGWLLNAYVEATGDRWDPRGEVSA